MAQNSTMCERINVFLHYLGPVEIPYTWAARGASLKCIRECVKKMLGTRRKHLAVVLEIARDEMSLLSTCTQNKKLISYSRDELYYCGVHMEDERYFGFVTRHQKMMVDTQVGQTVTDKGGEETSDWINHCHVFQVVPGQSSITMTFQQVSSPLKRETVTPVRSANTVVNYIRQMYGSGNYHLDSTNNRTPICLVSPVTKPTPIHHVTKTESGATTVHAVSQVPPSLIPQVSANPTSTVAIRAVTTTHTSILGNSSHETQSGPSWMTQYKKAIERQCSVSLNIIRCVLVGPPKVGKSCLKHLLVHNESKEVTTSTPLLESPEVVTFTATPELYMTHQGSSSVWQPIKDMQEIVKKWTMEEQYETQETQSTSGMKQDESGSCPHPSWKSTLTGKVSEDLKQTTLKTTVTVPVSSHTLLTALQEAHEHLQKDLEKGNLAHALDQRQLTLIHILDSGGQLAFQDTLPLLIGSPCTYVTVFNASVDLDQPVDITYRAQDGSEAKLDHLVSQWDMMLRTFSSVHTMEYKCHEGIRQILQDGSTLPHSRIAVVGTHKEKLISLPNRNDFKKKMITYLGGIEESKPYRVLRDQSDNPYFLIDNLHGIDPDYINSLRKTLSSKECILPLKVPLMWLMVELTTQRMDQKFIRYNELKQFCLQRRYINVEDADAQFHSLVTFLHNLGFYAFYDLEGISEADNLVCTDAASLYREVSRLLVVQYMKNPNKEATRLFRKTGIVEDANVAELFNEVNIDPEIDHNWFLRVLHHIRIAAKVTLERCRQFFIPLVLPFNRADLPSKTSVSPLCFTLVFSDQLGPFCKQNECDLPRGIFPYLVVHLANQHHNVSSKRKWDYIPKHSDRTHIVFNCTEFTMCLTEQAGHMEVAILLTESFFPSKMGLEDKFSKLHSLCRDIHQTVTAAINSTCEQMFGRQFAGRAKVQSGFLCTCGEGGSHLSFSKSTELAHCSIETHLLSRKLSSREKIWFSSERSEVEFALFENDKFKFQIMEDISDTKPSRCELTPFDQKTFMDKYRDRFMEYVPADAVVYKWEVYNIIDENTLDKVEKASPSNKNAILFRYIRKNGSLYTLREMSDFLIETGKHGYPHVKSLGEDIREDLKKYSLGRIHIGGTCKWYKT